MWWERQNPLLLDHTNMIVRDELMVRAVAIGWWVLTAHISAITIGLSLGHDRRSREARLFSDLLAGTIYIGAALIILSFDLHVPIGGMIATSGVFAIVLGLALQNTLADVFSGIAVGVEQPFHVGDRIKLNERIEGRVVEVNWRSIRIQTDENDVAIVPNSTVAKAEIDNRSCPSDQRSGKVELQITSAAPPSQITSLLGQAALLCPEILADPAPDILLTRLGERSNGFAMLFSVADPNEFARAKSLLLNQMSRLLHHAGLLMTDRALEGSAPIPMSVAGLLSQTIIFESLTDVQIKHLADNVQIRHLEAGEVLFSQGEVDASLYIVSEGVLEMSRTTPFGRPEVIGRLGAGDYIGAIGLLAGAPRSVTAHAINNVSVHALRKDAIAPLLETETLLVAAFEKSVRRGQKLLGRNAVSRVESEETGPSPLLGRIKDFFGLK